MKGSGPRRMAATVSLAVALSGVSPGVFAGQEISCESHGMRHTFCPTGRHGEVRLMSSAGFWPCRQGDTFGVENDGIWVDSGCKGRFWVEDAGGGGGGHDRTGAVVAGVVGLALLAAIASSHNKNDERGLDSHDRLNNLIDDRNPDRGYDGDRGLPTWMIGRFNGYNPRQRAQATLDVGSGGRVTASVQSWQRVGSYNGNGEIRWDDGRSVSRVERTDRGVRLTDGRDDITDFYRDR